MTIFSFQRDSYFGRVSNDFAMDQVECLGHEEDLRLCPHSKPKVTPWVK